MDTLEILAPRAWTRPDSYIAFDDSANPVGHYVIAAQHRDSDVLERSNFECIKRDMSELPGSDNWLYTFSASHWAVGWVEYLILRNDAPETALGMAAEIVAALEDYPVYDESHYSDLEYTEICEAWESLTPRGRAAAIKHTGANCSIFAARRAFLPEDDNGALWQFLRG